MCDLSEEYLPFQKSAHTVGCQKKNKMLVSQEHKESYGTQARAPYFNTMEAWYRDTLGDVDRLDRWA